MQQQEDLTGERIITLLFRRRMNQGHIARALDTTQSNISAKIRGRRRWYYDEVVQVARVLETSVAYLTGEVDDDAPLRTVEQGEEWARWGSNPRPAD
ncbi:hypothetical protein C5B85_18680, partial [Pseudoclavibacter sp. AY1F1]